MATVGSGHPTRAGRSGNARRGYSWSAYGTNTWNSSGGSAASHADNTARRPVKQARGPILSHAPMALILCGALFLFGFANLTQVAQATRAAKDVSALKTELSRINRDNETLASEISELESATRIRSLALNKLGMVEPVQVVLVDIPQQALTASSSAVAQNEGETSWLTKALRALGGV